MPTVRFEIDFGDGQEEPLESHGLAGELYEGEPITCAQDVIDLMKADAKRAHTDLQGLLKQWGLLDHCGVTVTFIPDVPAEIQPDPMVYDNAVYGWRRAHQTTASWEE